jgi:nickel-dependent lactate racemase
MMIGLGSADKLLSHTEIVDLCGQVFDSSEWNDKRILFIIPDHTRSAPLDVMFKILYQLLAGKARTLDFLIALGTHPPMTEAMIFQRVGITAEEYRNKYARARFFNHHWKERQQLVDIGTIGADEIHKFSGGLLSNPVSVTMNKLILDYDILIILGPVFPHEVIGFSGGNKYLFPGIAGQDIIDMFHWLSALITNVRINGRKYTPVRRIVDRAAEFVPLPRMCLCMVVKNHELAGLYYGTPEEAWSAAADLSDKVHICYKNHPYRRVLSCAPTMYDDLWTGGKCMYKLEPVVADGGEIIIYAPHISQVSVSHGTIIEKIGYHVRDYYTSQMDRFAHIPGGVRAHSTHVKGIGVFRDGIEIPRIHVSLATQIPPHLCKKINLGYCDPAKIKISEWQDREDEGVLLVPQAGEILYRLYNDPFTD